MTTLQLRLSADDGDDVLLTVAMAYSRRSHPDLVGKTPARASDEGMDAWNGVVINPGAEILPDPGEDPLRVVGCAWPAGYLKARSSGDLCPSPSLHIVPCRQRAPI